MKTNDEAIKVANIYAQWIDECIHYKSGHTIDSCRNAINSFIDFLEREKRMTKGTFCTAEVFSVSNLKEWVLYMKTVKMSKPQSCNVRLSSLRAFLKHLATKDAVYSAIYLSSRKVEFLKTEKQLPVCMSKEAVKAALAAPDATKKGDYRDVILMSLAYSTGCRINEILSLQLEDLRFDSKTSCMTVNGKGNKHRTLFLPRNVVSNLKGYIDAVHGQSPDKKRFLFFSKVKGPYEKLSHEAIRKRVRKHGISARSVNEEIPENLHMHHFRHAMALHRLEDDMNIYQLSKEMGHENLQTTANYVNMKPGLKEKAIVEAQSQNIRTIPKKWKIGGTTIKDLFTLK